MAPRKGALQTQISTPRLGTRPACGRGQLRGWRCFERWGRAVTSPIGTPPRFIDASVVGAERSARSGAHYALADQHAQAARVRAVPGLRGPERSRRACAATCWCKPRWSAIRRWPRRRRCAGWRTASSAQALVRMAGSCVEQFIAVVPDRPSELVLDFDATDDPVHGQQERPLLPRLLRPLLLPAAVRLLRRAVAGGLPAAQQHRRRASTAAAILKLLVKRLRQAWPQVKIMLRGDSGFCRWRLMRWCDRTASATCWAWRETRRWKRQRHATGAANAQPFEQTGTSSGTSASSLRGGDAGIGRGG